MSYLKVKDAPIDANELWFEGEVDDEACHANECYQYFLIKPGTTIKRVEVIIYDMSLAGIQAQVYIGKLEDVK